MTASPEQRALDFLALLGFVVLFPGFVLYHHAVAVGWIPAVLGGLFGGAATLLAVVSIVSIAGVFLGRLSVVPALEWSILGLLALFFVWTFAAGAVLSETYYAEQAVRESLTTLTIWLAVYFVGSRLTLDRRMSAVLVVAVIVIVGILVHAMLMRRSFIGPFLEFHGERDAQNESTTYQGIGRSILVLAIVFGCVQAKIWRHISVLALAALALLAVGSRSHLMASVAVLLTVIMLAVLRRGNRVSGMLFIVVLFIVGQALAELFLDTRAGELLDLSRSTSWQARLRAQARVLEVLAQNPFLGDFGYHHAYRVPYVHNVLSAWAEYGAVGFLAYVGVNLYALYLAASRVVRDEPSPLWRIAFQLNLVALLLGVATESIFSSVFPALAWGVTVNALRQERGVRGIAAQPGRALSYAEPERLARPYEPVPGSPTK